MHPAVHPLAEKVFNLVPSDVGRPITNIKPNIDLPELEKLVREAIHTLRPSEAEVQDRDGRWYSFRIFPYKTIDDKIDGALLLLVDIDVLKRSEQLRESEHRFRTLADTLPQLVWTCLPDGNYDYFNSQWTAYTGRSQDELLGGQWREVVNPVDRARTGAYWLEALTGDVPYDLEYRIRRKDGEYHWFKVRANPVRNSEGKIIKWFGTCTDIEEHKRHEAELQAAHDELERKVAERTAQLRETVQELEAFSYSVSHDLRSPLRAMLGYTDMALEAGGEHLDPTIRGAIEHIATAAGRLDTLIQDVLSYSRVTRGEIKLAPVDLDRLVRDIVQEYPGFQLPKVEITIENPLRPVMGHAAYLTQAIGNLLSNAVKFVAADRVPKVTVSTEAKDGQVQLWVADNGIGIEAGDLKRIFSIFERLHPAHEYEGTGIGLSIVRKAVERMGGTVGVESEAGKGSRFWIRLDAAQPL